MCREGKHLAQMLYCLLQSIANLHFHTQNEVAQLVDTRNEAREKLLQAIKVFTVQTEEKLGDGSRMKLLKVLIMNLQCTLLIESYWS